MIATVSRHPRKRRGKGMYYRGGSRKSLLGAVGNQKKSNTKSPWPFPIGDCCFEKLNPDPYTGAGGTKTCARAIEWRIDSGRPEKTRGTAHAERWREEGVFTGP